ncbi:sirohydrochlorin chelatase [Sandaracinus amylolyticus]|uniref:Sirohydrochlorin cobaltochelatase n=1 Tax=Sandaracinus amylolyticus TaxID=927083 RepID=A0A0F6WA96_9BACT|nr:CbiX/SirB N-terminal domain-containing protein [Sandaracinus amylolyticus]AKF11340.1 Sirohydrochlorin cobaltochelatase [Sandaracinus amylolyticus]
MRAILLVDHGSRVDAANAQLGDVAQLVARIAGDGTIVRHAHMELATPSIPEGIDALVREGATEIVVVPYFLAPGRHATSDVPRIASEAASKHPAVNVRVAAPLGVHELLARLVLVRARE